MKARGHRTGYFLIAGLLCSLPGRAQGLDDAFVGASVPHSSAAASDDVFATFANPAGLAFVDAFQGTLGFNTALGGAPDQRAVGSMALQLFDGLTFGAGGGLWQAGAGEPSLRSWGLLSTGLALDRTFSLGASARYLNAGDEVTRSGWSFDLGTQLRPARWLSFGGTFEGLGGTRLRDGSVRASVALRPFAEWLTLSADVRARPGTESLLDLAVVTTAPVDAALTARLHIGGLALTAGAFTTDALDAQQRSLGANVGIELDTSHLGALFLSGIDQRGSITAGTYGRFSVERFASVLPRRGRWLTFSLVGDGTLETTPENLLEEFFDEPPHPSLVLAALHRAAEDPEVEGVVLRLRGLSLGWGRIEELRQAIMRLRNGGKQVVAHLDAGDDADLYLVSAADHVYLAPPGSVDLDGVHVTLTYVAGLLEQLGVRAEAIAAGGYKTAPRAFTDREPSQQELEVQRDILDLVYGQLVQGLASARELSEERVRELIEQGGLSSDEALAADLVDGLVYFGDVPSTLEELCGRRVTLDDGYLEQTRRDLRWAEPSAVAVIPIVGQIVPGRSGSGPFGALGESVGADDVIDALDKAARDPRVKAVVLRIDSPGGDALASDLIWRAAMELREKKPVIASMGDVAASGGYYIAAGAQEIFAQPATLTGSIGVFALLFTAEELADDLGVASYEVSRGAEAPPSLAKSLSDTQRARLERQVAGIYQRFLGAIMEGRGMEETALKEVAEGRVWTGEQAKARGLVDTLGGLEQALERAIELGGLDRRETDLRVIRPGSDVVPVFAGALAARIGFAPVGATARRLLGALGADPAQLQLLLQGAAPLAMEPVSVTVE